MSHLRESGSNASTFPSKIALGNLSNTIPYLKKKNYFIIEDNSASSLRYLLLSGICKYIPLSLFPSALRAETYIRFNPRDSPQKTYIGSIAGWRSARGQLAVSWPFKTSVGRFDGHPVRSRRPPTGNAATVLPGRPTTIKTTRVRVYAHVYAHAHADHPTGHPTTPAQRTRAPLTTDHITTILIPGTPRPPKGYAFGITLPSTERRP
jgi:hypothetical protein